MIDKETDKEVASKDLITDDPILDDELDFTRDIGFKPHSKIVISGCNWFSHYRRCDSLTHT